MISRNLTVDIAKGIGILFVVLGHNWTVKSNPGELFRIIFSFHVPLFFFMSGLFLKESDHLRSFIVRKVDTLLKPYWVVLSFVGLLKAFNPFNPSRTSFSISHYWMGVLYGTGPTIEGVALWFVPHLFISSVLTVLILCWTSHLKARRFWLGTIALLSLTLGIQTIRTFWHIDTHSLGWIDGLFPITHPLPGLPWSLDITLISSSFMLIGFLSKDIVKSCNFNFKLFLTSLILFGLIHLGLNETIDLNQRFYGQPIVSSVQALLGIYLVISGASALRHHSTLSPILVSIGSGSLFILIFHTFIQEKVFNLFLQLTHWEIFSAIVSFGAGVWVPLGILALVKRHHLLGLLLLPHKSH